MVWWLSGLVRKGQQPPWVVPDELWERIEPLLTKVERRYRYPGRKRLDDRKVLSGILFVLYTGIPWEFLPQELGVRVGDDQLPNRRRSSVRSGRTSSTWTWSWA